MNNSKINTAVIDASTAATLRSSWLQLIADIHHSTTEDSGLECATRCTARCCPKAKTATDNASAVGHVAIMLPFEMEYIRAKTPISSATLQLAPVEFTADISVDIAYTTSASPCPFLTHNNACGIHDIRPLDCRSFPLIPVFNQDDSLSFRVDQECPSTETFASSYNSQLQKIWHDLLPHLPMSYRMLYNQL